jgi:bile acid:Na+ symporter, BASS family
MLMELLSKAATVAMLSFVVSSMLAMGAGLTVSQISEPLAMPGWSCLRCWPILS